MFSYLFRSKQKIIQSIKCGSHLEYAMFTNDFNRSYHMKHEGMIKDALIVYRK